jgi:hypothetical protein
MSTYSPPTPYAPLEQRATVPYHQGYDGRMACGLFMTIIGFCVLTMSILVGKLAAPKGYVALSDQADWENTLGWCVIAGAGALFVILLGVILIAGAERIVR